MRAATLATLISVTASNAAAADFDELIRRAAEARDAGDAEGTLSYLEQAYQLRPIPELLNNIGRTLEELGRYDQAAEAYRRVLADPSAKPALLELDRQRLQAVEPKLGRAWLLVRSDEASAYLDGDPVVARVEIEVPAGPHMLELSSDRNAALVFFSAVESRRVEIARSVRERVETDAAIDLEGAPVRALFINDRPIRSELLQLRIALPAGSYRLRVETPDGVQSKQVRIREGHTLALRSALEPPRSAPPPVTTLVMEEPRALEPWPIALGSAAVVIGAVGGLLVGLAEQDRRRVRNADRDSEGVVVGLTMIEAVRLESKANEKATAGIVTLSSAGALGIGALLWWVF